MLIGKKVGMTQKFASDGAVVPVTVIKAGPCVVVRLKTRERDGYDAVQLGFVESSKKARAANKPHEGLFKKAGVAPCRVLREFRIEGGSEENLAVGGAVKVSMFTPSDKVSVSGVSKGKGFAGVVKRHGFAGGRATHGSMFHRAPGSIGQSAFPSRVLPGMRAAGHMGQDRVTVRNLEVIEVIEDEDLLLVRGAVPGANGSYVEIVKTRSHRNDA
ncbi:MAG TPA: 50S ribosomal protein L3 [Vicinamibacteria bacterium]|nr:50S ribosomal protein L3 [Vicinamibacteria bacterium]